MGDQLPVDAAQVDFRAAENPLGRWWLASHSIQMQFRTAVAADSAAAVALFT